MTDKPEQAKPKKDQKASSIVIKKIKKGHAGHHGGSWKVAFADFAVAMMAFFLLMWILAAATEAQKTAITGYFQNPLAPVSGDAAILLREMFNLTSPTQQAVTEIGRSALESFLKEEQGKTDKDDEDTRAIVEQLTNGTKSGELEIEVKTDRFLIRISEHNSFNSGSADLMPSFIPILQKVAQAIKVTPGRVTISGYTDNVAINNEVFRSNRELSAVRAVSVAEELLKNKKLDPERFVVQGYGENEPIASNDDEDGRTKNRRVEIEIYKSNKKENQAKTITIEKDADTKLLPNIEKIKNINYVTFPPATNVEFDASGEYLEKGELGVFEKDSLYNYELKDLVVPATVQQSATIPPKQEAAAEHNNHDIKSSPASELNKQPYQIKSSDRSSKAVNHNAGSNKTTTPDAELGLFKESGDSKPQDKKPDDLGVFKEKEVQDPNDLGIVKQQPKPQVPEVKVEQDLKKH